MHLVVATLCSLLVLATCLGCSTLGFPTTPVAHTMTDQTKQVLECSPQHPPSVPRELNKRVLQTHYLEPGDELLIESNDIESEFRLPADQQVSADGSVDLAEYGRVKVAGLTLEQAEELIQLAISRASEEPANINVRLIQSVQRFYVIGEVNSPGAYPLAGHETVLDGIVAAGGLTMRASACDLLLARPTDPCSCRVTLPVCYRAITQLGDTTTNYQLLPGDRIFVGGQTFWEEVLQCCCCEKSCDRCCKQQLACPDPIMVDPAKPAFAIPETQTSAGLIPSELIESQQETMPWHGVNRLPRQDASLPEPVIIEDDSHRNVQPLLDGELDFGESFQQP